MVYTGSVGASGSSPALRPACLQCVCFGRPSSRPYSYAMGRCGDYQSIIGGIYSYAVDVAVITKVLLVVYTATRWGVVVIAGVLSMMVYTAVRWNVAVM